MQLDIMAARCQGSFVQRPSGSTRHLWLRDDVIAWSEVVSHSMTCEFSHTRAHWLSSRDNDGADENCEFAGEDWELAVKDWEVARRRVLVGICTVNRGGRAVWEGSSWPSKGAWRGSCPLYV